MFSNVWLVLGLLAFSVLVTLTADWLIAGLWRPPSTLARSLSAVTADLIWMLLVFLAGLIAARYIERTPNAVLGYLAFGLGALAVSVLRAHLYRRSRDEQLAEQKLDTKELARTGLHNLTYLLFAAILYLALAGLQGRPAEPVLFIPLFLGALLPDLDSRTSIMGRLLPFISWRMESRLGRRQVWHTPAAAGLLALVTAPLIPLVGMAAWAAVPLGFLSHLGLDLLSPQGVMLAWPVKRTRFSLLGGFVDSPGSVGERRLFLILVVVTIILLLLVDIAPSPPPPVATLSYKQTLDRYHSLRGRNLALADVGGTWQATGRRVRARFEVLSAADQSYIMRDDFTGRVFSAGRTAADNLYLDRISVVAGAPVRIKAVEIQLRDEPLAAALPIVYEMQHEPGLQHIYVSGDVVVPTAQDMVSPSLPIDYAQTSLRRIQSGGAGQYTLHFLAADELIELAGVGTETADLVIVATYTSPPSGPTATPLPTPTATPVIHRPEEESGS
jgi:inner membrane protein